jgi:hypothetical protein
MSSLPIGYGPSKPIIKYDAKAAKWKLDTKVMNGISMIVDMDNLEIGPMRFVQGGAPDFRTVPAASLGSGGTLPAAPPDKDEKGKPLYVNGFKVTVKVSDQIAGTSASVREWASNSGATCSGLNKLYDGWRAEKDKHPDKLPVCKMTSTEVKSGAFGDNYMPVLEIVKWLDRPADLMPRAVSADVVASSEVDDVSDTLENDDWSSSDPVDCDVDPDEASFS